MKYLSLWPNTDRQLLAPFQLFKDFDDLFEEQNSNGKAFARFQPALDIEESEKDYQISFDVPGMKREDIKIELKDRTLIVSGERKREEKTSTKGLTRFERSYGQFTRSLALPADAEVKAIEAEYQNGVLKLVIPKSEAAQPRLIEVK